ncbi:MAG: hypothetical protein M1828_006626 [Chrysothrix sp. TS-e1954]|nr:MAG: hypothetical protein M1828_006626 [Chrysothrix sp. TS-e1954]
MTAKHRRGPWSQAEDGYLLQLVQTQGAHNWVRISQLIQSRSPKQCRERYHQNLKPSLNLNPITPEEGVLIERMVAEMGKRWAEIARRLHGRSDNAVKNWWNGGMNRRKRFDSRRGDTTSRQPQSQYLGSSQLQMPRMGDSLDTAIPTHSQRQVEIRHGGHPMPPPLDTHHIKPLLRTQAIDTPIPSPSAISHASRDDSSEGQPPSLISDSGTYSAYSQSPHSSVQNNELPSLTAMPSEHPHQMTTHHLQQHGQPCASDKHHPYAANYYSYPGGFSPNYNQWQQHTPVLPSQHHLSHSSNQLPLPGFRTITAPPSPPKDSRMSLSNVIA